MDKRDSSQQQRREMMLNEPIYKIIPQMAIPTIIAFLINSIYSLADTYFVSSLGTNATAAVSVNSSLDQLIMMTGSMLAMGASSYISRLLGKGDADKASQVLSTCFFLAVGLGTVLMLVGTTFMTPMVRLLGATPTCETYSIQYATYVLMAAPFMAGSFVTNHCLRSEGSATLSMIGMGFGGILNVILDPIFIFTLDMGVAGASLATAISKLVSFSILIFPYITRRSLLNLSIRNVHFSKDIIVTVFSVGSSSMFRSGLAVISAIMLNSIAGGFSDSVLAGIGVGTKIMMFPFGVILGLGSGFQPVAGFNWGAKRYDRVQKSYRFASGLAVVCAVIMAGTIAIFANTIITLFAGTDPEMLRIGALSLRLQCLTMVIHAWGAIVNMLCVGLGNAKGAFLLATSRQGTCFIPILYPLAFLFQEIGVACAAAAADVISLGMIIPIAVSMSKKIRQAQANQMTATQKN